MLIKLVFIRNIDSDILISEVCSKLLFDDYYKIKILFSIVKSKLTHRKSIENKTILLLNFFIPRSSKWVQSLWCIYQSFIIGKRRRNIDIEITFTYIWFNHTRVLRCSHVVSYVNDIFTYLMEKDSNIKYSFYYVAFHCPHLCGKSYVTTLLYHRC